MASLKKKKPSKTSNIKTSIFSSTPPKVFATWLSGFTVMVVATVLYISIPGYINAHSSLSGVEQGLQKTKEKLSSLHMPPKVEVSGDISDIYRQIRQNLFFITRYDSSIGFTAQINGLKKKRGRHASAPVIKGFESISITISIHQKGLGRGGLDLALGNKLLEKKMHRALKSLEDYPFIVKNSSIEADSFKISLDVFKKYKIVKRKGD